MTDHTPTPWHADPDDREGYEWNIHILDKSGENLICFMSNGPQTEANASLIVAAVNNYAPMLNSLKSCAKLFDVLADRCDRWAKESQYGGWSTHQVQPNKETANDCRRYAAEIRAALPH